MDNSYMNLIVSNQKIDYQKTPVMSYQEFCSKAFSGEGLYVTGKVYINVHDIQPDVYEAIKGSSQCVLITPDGEVPEFISSEGTQVENWDFLNNATNPGNLSVQDAAVANLLSSDGEEDNHEDKLARVVVFGSAKGGSGKTFTSVMSAYQYAITHPHQKIALVDFDVIDGQVGITIHCKNPTMKNYYLEYQKGNRGFPTLHGFAVHGGEKMPQNIDFYLAPSTGNAIENTEFWVHIIDLVIHNYDLVVFDTGIDYLGKPAISFAYKAADRINLTTTTSIKSVNSVKKQIDNLTGKIQNGIFEPSDEIGSKIGIVITQVVPSAKTMNEVVFGQLMMSGPIVCIFGVLTDSIAEAEYYGKWNVFDKNRKIAKAFRDLIEGEPKVSK